MTAPLLFTAEIWSFDDLLWCNRNNFEYFSSFHALLLFKYTFECCFCIQSYESLFEIKLFPEPVESIHVIILGHPSFRAREMAYWQQSFRNKDWWEQVVGCIIVTTLLSCNWITCRVLLFSLIRSAIFQICEYLLVETM